MALTDGKSVGYDFVNNKLLRFAAPQIATPLTFQLRPSHEPLRFNFDLEISGMSEFCELQM